MAVPEDREAALITFLVTASGMSLLGLSAAFWGLIFGLAAHLLLGAHRPRAQTRPGLLATDEKAAPTRPGEIRRQAPGVERNA